MSNLQQRNDDVAAQATDFLNPAVIERAYTIIGFIESGHPNGTIIDSAVKRLIEDITTRYPPPERSQSSFPRQTGPSLVTYRSTRSNPSPVP